MRSSHDILDRLFEVICRRNVERPAGSYTTQLLAAGTDEIAAKLREEAGELAEAAEAKSPDRRQVVHETADLMYHLLVLLVAGGLSLDEVRDELARRFGTSGIDEKAAREPR